MKEARASSGGPNMTSQHHFAYIRWTWEFTLVFQYNQRTPLPAPPSTCSVLLPILTLTIVAHNTQTKSLFAVFETPTQLAGRTPPPFLLHFHARWHVSCQLLWPAFAPFPSAVFRKGKQQFSVNFNLTWEIGPLYSFVSSR